MITIDDKKLVKYLTDKDKLVNEGIATSKEIEKIELKIEKCETKEKEITAKIKPKKLGDEAEALKQQINDLIKKFEKVAGDITKEKLAGIPKKLEKEHKDLLKLKEKKERERNKIALKVQKIKDRAIPIIQKAAKPQLKEYEDIETATVRNGFVKVKTYSRLEEWKEAFKKKN
jgi:predicted  nucleic acid-binding Zn-ribbon protein